jgi:hypothetical protein
MSSASGALAGVGDDTVARFGTSWTGSKCASW